MKKASIAINGIIKITIRPFTPIFYYRHCCKCNLEIRNEQIWEAIIYIKILDLLFKMYCCNSCSNNIIGVAKIIKAAFTTELIYTEKIKTVLKNLYTQKGLAPNLSLVDRKTTELLQIINKPWLGE